MICGGFDMDYETIIDLDNVTIEDCIDLHRMKNITVEINDGRITNFIKE